MRVFSLYAATLARRSGIVVRRHAKTTTNVEEIRAAAGTPRSIELLQQIEAPSEEAYLAVFPFELDDFQISALRSLRERNVIVSAPTGSGKTVAGELAIAYALARKKRAFYTTPLKALSNQKFLDFRRKFGRDRVGLLTGDSGINREAPVVVMTTEVFRNMLYRQVFRDSSDSSLFAVVFDEFHYMSDPQRGTVWEESVISCPPTARIVALSATVSNAEELRAWIAKIHGPTDLVESSRRPVPLRYEYGTVALFKHGDVGPGSRKGMRNLGLNPKALKDDATVPELVVSLRKRDLLPALVFVFSRHGCSQGASELDDLNFLTSKKQRRYVRERCASVAFPVPPALRSLLERGIAYHHAGLLPEHKLVVEELFAQGLVKICFATETLAAGVNLPARTTVITALSKRGDEGMERLTSTNVLQMAGRAGRRGLDESGTVVFVKSSRWRHEEDANLARQILLSRVEPVASRFRATYGMACSLLRRLSLERCKRLVDRSFAFYSSSSSSVPGDVREYVELATRAEDLESVAREIPSLREAAELALTQVRETKIGRLPRAARDRAKSEYYAASGAAQKMSAQWRAFVAVRGVLAEYGAISPKNGLTSLGEMVAELKADNELLVAVAVRSRGFQKVAARGTAAEFAAVVSTLAADDRRVITDLVPSNAVCDAVRALDEEVDKLNIAQLLHGVDDIPVRVDLEVAALVEAFASGADWRRVADAASLDDGDLVRLFRRTTELLRSIAALRDADPDIKRAAKRAADTLDRPPVLDYVPPDDAS